ncbi:hypothetical protein JX265_013118 [Neoarthrinium moseri]|uniref:Uncharacterized protein n=1 Tax=Neoarthrinium moseri TaxID=1658444 RepID=A0A9Q0AJ26_9PEZI|nr:hypothetical protein JX265_013118 [Neoarthrinium moseri]
MTRFGLEPLTAADWAKWRAFRTRHRSRPEWQFLDHVQAEIRRLERATPDLGLADLTRPSWAGTTAAVSPTRSSSQPAPTCAAAGERTCASGGPRSTRSRRSCAARRRTPGVQEGMEQAGRHVPGRGDGGAGRVRGEISGGGGMPRRGRRWQYDQWNRTQAAGFSDVGSWAYWRVRSQWERRRIWYHAWQVLPGNAWAHELPVKRWYASNGFRHPREMKRHRRARCSRGGVAKGTTARYRNAGKKRRGVRWVDYLGDLDLRESDPSDGDEVQGVDGGIDSAWLPARIQHRQENLTFSAVRTGPCSGRCPSRS